MAAWDGLEEAVITSIRVDAVAKSASIELSHPSKIWEQKKIIATGVDEFVASEVRISNVIDRVFKLSGSHDEEMDKFIAQRIFFAMRGREPLPDEFNWPALKSRMDLLRQGLLTLLLVEAIHGATLLILARTIEIEG